MIEVRKVSNMSGFLKHTIYWKVFEATAWKSSYSFRYFLEKFFQRLAVDYIVKTCKDAVCYVVYRELRHNIHYSAELLVLYFKSAASLSSVSL